MIATDPIKETQVKFFRYGMGAAAVLGGALFFAGLMSIKPPETFEQYSDRCLVPQTTPIKRDLTCIQDAQKFGSASSTQRG